MKKININLFLVACLLMVSSLSFGQLKFGDKSTVGQTLSLDNASGVATVDLTFNTDKNASSASVNADSAAVGVDYYNISIQKCGTNKGFQVNVYDEAGSAVVNSDFRCRRYNSYENPVRVKSVESLKAILAAYAVNDAATETSVQNPAHCLFDLPFTTTYDFTDSVVFANKVSDDGLLTINDGVKWHSRDYALDMKTGSQMEIIVVGDATIAFLGSQYSSLSMKAEAKSGNGTFAVDSMSTIVVNDRADYFTFEYTGSADTLVFTAVADGGSQDTDVYLPKVVVSGTNPKDQAFGAWPGKYKQVEYGFNVKFDGSNVENDITFSIDTYDEGNTGSTASYELTVYIGGTDVSNLVATVADFYVTGSGLKEVSLAEAAGLTPADFASKNVYWFLKTAGTGNAIADDSFDPIIVVDNMVVSYNPPAWVIPAAGITGNGILETTIGGTPGVDTLFTIPLKTASRLGSLNIVNDLQDKTAKPFATFLAEGALMAKDENGEYTVPVTYSIEPSVYNPSTYQWSNAKITIAAPADGPVSDDLMFKFKARVVEDRTMSFRLELDHGTRIWYDINVKDNLILKHAYTFEEGVDDVVGTADGELQGAATVANGALVTAANGDYLKLPASKIAINKYSAVTLEAMVTTGTNDGWTMLAYFGSAWGDNSYWMSIARADDVSKTAIDMLPGSEEVGPTGTEPAPNEMHHYVSVLTDTTLSLYIDGVLANKVTTPASHTISGITLDTAVVCAGGYPDPTWNGSLHEFNIYEGVLPDDMIAAHADEFLNPETKIAYVNDAAKSMVEVAAQTDSDPIITMLKADENFVVDVLLVANDSAVDLTGYDLVIAQEGFGSSSDIFKPAGALGMGSIEVPFILNKAYTMKAGRGFADGAAGSGGEVEGTLTVNVSEAGAASEIFTGIDATAAVKVFNTGAADDGSRDRRKGLQFATDVVISADATLLASGVDDPETATVCINDIPAGATIGSETLKARMIAISMNYGAICANEGTNFTDEGLTIWRNAIYSLAGLDVPAELYDAPEFVSAKEVAIEGVEVYPNPVENNLTVVGLNRGASITIYSTVGQVVMRSVANDSKTSINVESLKDGIYMMKVEMNGASSVSRFVKQ